MLSKDGDTLSALKMNDNFDALDARLTTLETTAAPSLTLLAQPVIKEFSFTGPQAQEITLPAGIEPGMTAILANVFVTANTSDQQNFHLGNGCMTLQQSFVTASGQQPSVTFGALNRPCVSLTYYGEGDGFTSNYGIWYSSQVIPLKPNAKIDFNNLDSSTNSNGWVYLVILGYYK